MSGRDSQRLKVYQAEDFARTLFTRAAQHNSRTIDFFGSPLTLPPEARFSGVESIRRWLDPGSHRIVFISGPNQPPTATFCTIKKNFGRCI